MASKDALTTVPLKQWHEPEPSTAPHSAYGEPSSLYLGFKVFLSHSGKDKDFVRRLYRELSNSYHGIDVAFFDEESLPKGRDINMEKSILEEARGSKLGVLVLTDDFFTHTRNPMLELEAFVDGEVDLLPLFLTMSVEEFKQKERRGRWERRWEEWAAADDGLVNVAKWRSHLKIASRHNGLEFSKIAPTGRQDIYIDEVVKQVAGIIGPTVRMCGEEVYGMDRLCQVVDCMYRLDGTSKHSFLTSPTLPQPASTSCTDLGSWENGGSCAYDLVGIYGFPGLGKTTLCQGLCDFYFREMKGKVCYIDLGEVGESRLSSMQHRHSRMWHVLSRLVRGNTKNLALSTSQVENLMRKRLSSLQYPIFLAIDNVLPQRESQEEALTYLRCEFPKSSKIFITSKTEAILTNLAFLLPRSCNALTVIEYMPALEFEEARQIFEHQFPYLVKLRRSNMEATEEKLQRDVATCVDKCTIFGGTRYHPLMLKSLAAFVKWDGSMPHRDWKGRLAKLASEGIIHKEDAWEQVFEVVGITYNGLDDATKTVFLDLVVCYSATRRTFMSRMGYYEWIKMLHVPDNLSENGFEKTLLQLHNLCFIEKYQCNQLHIHDLMEIFGKHQAGVNSKRYGFVVLEDGACWWPGTLRIARHISIARCREGPSTLDLRNVEGVTVLHLLDNAGLEKVLLSGTTTANLRSVIVSVPARTELHCIDNDDWRSGQSLKWLWLSGKINFCSQSSLLSLTLSTVWMPLRLFRSPEWMPLRVFRNLEELTLHSFSACSAVQSIDLTPLSHLKNLQVVGVPGLKSILVPESSSCLERVRIIDLPNLEKLAFPTRADSKTDFSIVSCFKLQRVSLYCAPPSISYAEPEGRSNLTIQSCPNIQSVDGLLQYTSGFIFEPASEGTGPSRFWTQTFIDLVKDVGSDLSRCKAKVRRLRFNGLGKPAGLESLRTLALGDAQNVGLLITAIFLAQPTYLEDLDIWCQQAGDGCGCEQNVPIFCNIPFPGYTNDETSSARVMQIPGQYFGYHCPQVRDLASLARWRSLDHLDLSGCTNVEVWPDFAAMTSLLYLDLSNTSLREWPSKVDLLHGLRVVSLRGCTLLPAKELLLRGVKADPALEHKPSLAVSALDTLISDLSNESRDRCSVADALGVLCQLELAALFDRWSPPGLTEIDHDANVVWRILRIMCRVWFEDELGHDFDEGQKRYIREKMRGLLSSEGFLSLPFRVCSGRLFSEDHKQWRRHYWEPVMYRGIYAMVLGMVGGASLAYDESYRALPALDDFHLIRDSITFFQRNFLDLFSLDHLYGRLGFQFRLSSRSQSLQKLKEVVEKSVTEGLSKMAKEAGLEF